mmetsp:Transcript_50565/g.58188  ORF Transcript_50565/g.58188 Transcript_50565/m.58188 type:complete len:200 (+) Transcript_50565:35-634(+)
MKFYIHVREFKTDPADIRDTFIHELANGNITLKEFLGALGKVLPPNLEAKEIATSLDAAPLKNLYFKVSDVFEDGQDIFITYSMKELKIVENFENLSKYTYYEDDDKVKVLLDLAGVQAHPKENIEARFLGKSFELKVRGFNGKNYKFAVPKLQHRISPDECKFFLKTDKIVVSLKKANAKDVWFSLFRQKAVGGDESD